jgi:Fe-S-cluster-containing hydrogenase component 2
MHRLQRVRNGMPLRRHQHALQNRQSLKCDLCEGRAEGPVCADWCPSGAISYTTPTVAFKAKRREKLEERLKAAKVGEEA